MDRSGLIVHGRLCNSILTWRHRCVVASAHGSSVPAQPHHLYCQGSNSCDGLRTISPDVISLSGGKGYAIASRQMSDFQASFYETLCRPICLNKWRRKVAVICVCTATLLFGWLVIFRDEGTMGGPITESKTLPIAKHNIQERKNT